MYGLIAFIAFTFFQRCLKNISEKMGNLPSEKGKQIVSVFLYGF